MIIMMIIITGLSVNWNPGVWTEPYYYYYYMYTVDNALEVIH